MLDIRFRIPCSSCMNREKRTLVIGVANPEVGKSNQKAIKYMNVVLLNYEGKASIYPVSIFLQPSEFHTFSEGSNKLRSALTT